MAGRTISFPKGAGSLTHNNRDFIANNVCEERTGWNRTYVKESLAAAYEKCFGEAVREYNAGQKRSDRKIGSYIKKIENSDNGENVFYENIVQLGTKDDTPVVDAKGNLTEAAKEAIALLEEYVRTFQERNPNLYLFNCVLHLDEATPHLHIDYIPVAHGYKNGMKTRNSLSKALQEMGFAKGKGRYDNEVIDWEAREREYLTKLCQERGIEVEVKGDKRDNLSLPEYKAAMRKVEGLEAEAEKLDRQNAKLEDETHKLESGIAEKTAEYRKIEGQLGSLKAKKQTFERNVHVYEENPEWQLSEPTVFMSAKEYRTKIVLPLVQKLKKVIIDLTLRCIDALESVKKYKTRCDNLQKDIKFLSGRVLEQQDAISELRKSARTLDNLKDYFGESQIKEMAEVASQHRNVEQINPKSKSRGVAI